MLLGVDWIRVFVGIHKSGPGVRSFFFPYSNSFSIVISHGLLPHFLTITYLFLGLGCKLTCS